MMRMIWMISIMKSDCNLTGFWFNNISQKYDEFQYVSFTWHDWVSPVLIQVSLLIRIVLFDRIGQSL